MGGVPRKEAGIVEASFVVIDGSSELSRDHQEAFASRITGTVGIVLVAFSCEDVQRFSSTSATMTAARFDIEIPTITPISPHIQVAVMPTVREAAMDAE